MLPKKVISLVLGGGKGTRLYPLTDTRSKPAVPIAGKYRLVDIPISNCLNSGIHRIFVLTQYNSASLNSHIKNTFNFSVFSKGFVDILAAEQTNEGEKWYQGTADAVRRTQRYLQNHEFDYILILSGDQLYQLNFQEMISFHDRNGADITIATIPVNARDATSFGILKSDDQSNIIAFTEKPSAEKLVDWASEVSPLMASQGRNYLASMGIYIFNRQAIKEILANDIGTDFGKELIPNAIGNYKVCSFEYNGYWTDIGNIRSFFEANIALTDDVPEFNLYDSNTIFTRSRMLPPSKLFGTRLNKAVIADGCIISADSIERSVIGIRSRIGKGSVIKNTYMMGSDFYQSLTEIQKLSLDGHPLVGIGEDVHVENAVLDKSCAIGNGTRIKGGDHLLDGDFDGYTIQDGIVVVKRRAVIPPGTRIGC